MKNAKFFILLGLLLATGHWPLATVSWSADYYVSTTGYDTSPGSFAQPFKTVQRARDVVRALGRPLAQPVNVYLRGGTYYLSDSLTFLTQDSGNAGCTITYCSYPGETAVLSGGREITGPWTVDHGLWTTHIPEVESGNWYFRQLFVNGKRAVRAREPDAGETPNMAQEAFYRTAGVVAGNDNSAFRFYSGNMQNFANLSDVNVFIYHSWEIGIQHISSVNLANNIVYLNGSTTWAIHAWETNPRYYVENACELLDTPGEWYLNRSTGYLYYMPRAGEDTASCQFFAPVLRNIVNFYGNSWSGNYVDYISLKGLVIRHSDWPLGPAGYTDGQASAFSRSAAVTGDGARYCSVEDCEFSNIGEHAIWFGIGCAQNRIFRNNIHDIGGGGVYLGEKDTYYDGRISGSNTVDNNFIHDLAKVFRGAIGVWIGRSSYNNVTHNEICDLNYSAVSCGWSWGYDASSANNNIIEYNHLHHYGRNIMSDFGAIYTLGVSPGTRLRFNLIHDGYAFLYGGWGLYTDEGSSNILLENNVAYNNSTGGFHQHYGQNNYVYNNKLAYSVSGVVLRSRDETHRSYDFQRNIVYGYNNIMITGNWSNGQSTLLDYNCYWNKNDPPGNNLTFAGNSFAGWKGLARDTHSIVADPQFADPDNGDFAVLSGVPAAQIGFVEFDISAAGLYGSAGWTSLPGEVTRETLSIPAQFVFITPQRTTQAGAMSDSILIEVRDSSGRRCYGFNDSILLSSNSSDGRFSVDRSVWSASNSHYVLARDGQAVFYYRDFKTGTSLISTSSSGWSGISYASQNFTTTPPSSFLSVSPQVVSADGTASCVVVCSIMDSSFNPVQGRQATIYTNRGSSDSITQPGFTDANGICTGSIVSQFSGNCTVTAECEGILSVENKISNPSFEAGISSNAYYWAESNAGRDTSQFLIGSCSMKMQWGPADASAGSALSDPIDVIPGSLYGVSGWMRKTNDNVTQRIDLNGQAGQPLIYNTSSGAWNFQSGSWNSGLSSSVQARCYADRGLTGVTDNAYFDSIRLWRVPTVSWQAVSLEFVTAAFDISQNYAFPITLKARGKAPGGDADLTFNNTVTLASSSTGGRFSIDGSNWSATSQSAITFTSGLLVFYYKDPQVGDCVLTASRQGMEPDTLTGSVHAFSETNSYIIFTPYKIFADNSSFCSVTVSINDKYGNPVPGKSVLLIISRPESDTLKDSIGGSSLVQGTDANGKCAWALRSFFEGYDTITAVCEGATITRGMNRQGASGIWDFDSGLDDASGCGNNAYSSNPILSSGPDSSVFGKALYLDGTAGRIVKAPEDASLGFGTSDFSVEAWLRPSVFYSDQTRWLEKSSYPAEWWVMDIYPDGRLELEMSDDGGHNGTTSSAGSLQLNKWNHVAIAIDRKNFKAYYYLNGAPDSVRNISSSFTGGLNISGMEMVIGTEWSGHCFIGSIDGLKIYTRLLSAKEVNDSYNRKCAVNFIPRPVSEFSSFLRIPYPNRGKFTPDGVSQVQVAVYAADENNVPMQGQQVTVYSSRGASFDTITYPNGNTIDANGFCTAVIISPYAGEDTITARCGGVTITENIFNNPSFEAGAGSPTDWSLSGSTWTWDNSVKFSGNRSLQEYKTAGTDHYAEANWRTPALADKYPVSPNTAYKLSQYCRTDSFTVENAVIRLVWWKGDNYPADYLGEAVFAGIDGTMGWTLQSVINIMSSATTFLMCRPSTGNALGRAWFDCARMQRIPTLNWVADRFVFTTPPGSTGCGAISQQIKVSAGGRDGGADVTFSNTALLSTSSNSGHFSILSGPFWQDVTKVAFSAGQASFYYRDYNSGSPVITVSRADLGLLPGTQEEKINIAGIRIASPAFTMSAAGSAPLTVEARNSDQSVDTTFNNTLVLLSTSEKGKFSSSNTSWKDTTTVLLVSGAGTVFYRDRRAGNPLITVLYQALSFSDSQSETVVQPLITVEKKVFNERTGDTGVLTRISSGDTLIYILTVCNTGTNTATGIVITDTIVFDTGYFMPLSFISMETTAADSWSYRNAAGAWQAWGIAPFTGDNIKGLRWQINTLGINETRTIRFKVKVK